MASKSKTEVPSQVDMFDEMERIGASQMPSASVTEVDVTPVSKGMKVAFDFPEGTDSKVIQDTMAQMGRIAKQNAEAQNAMSVGKAKYVEQCKRRFKVIVTSLRRGWNTFEMIISDPITDRPIPVRGKCGVILEKGVTQYVINQLNYTHSHRTENGRSMTIDQILSSDVAIVMETKTVKEYHYRVEIIEEVTDPIPVGVAIGNTVI